MVKSSKELPVSESTPSSSSSTVASPSSAEPPAPLPAEVKGLLAEVMDLVGQFQREWPDEPLKLQFVTARFGKRAKKLGYPNMKDFLSLEPRFELILNKRMGFDVSLVGHAPHSRLILVSLARAGGVLSVSGLKKVLVANGRDMALLEPTLNQLVMFKKVVFDGLNVRLLVDPNGETSRV